ncbi:MAG: nucleotidyltransferase domain-containing protein, partial [Acidobacteriota bacterium]|nr:nucleotidyltransferase domain-containing protein [Acidobacteriota bacterium]
MTPEQNAAIHGCIEAVTASNPRVEFAAVLVGSVARGTSTERSDIDILFVSEHRLRRPRCAAQVHAQLFVTDELHRKLRSGDDLPSWCIRFGVPIVDPGIWQKITGCPEAAQWPDWKLKITHATRRLILASDLLRVGDLSAASEETLYALTHTARAMLLRTDVFPLSRPEMVEQVATAGYPSLAKLLQQLLAAEQDRRGL